MLIMNIFSTRALLKHAENIVFPLVFCCAVSAIAGKYVEAQQKTHSDTTIQSVQQQEKNFADIVNISEYTDFEQEHMRKSLNLMAKANPVLAKKLLDSSRENGGKKIYIQKIEGEKGSSYIPAENPNADKNLCFSDDVGYLKINLDITSFYLIKGGDKNNPMDYELLSDKNPYQLAATFGHEFTHFDQDYRNYGQDESKWEDEATANANIVRKQYNLPQRDNYKDALNVDAEYFKNLENTVKELDSFAVSYDEMANQSQELGDEVREKQLRGRATELRNMTEGDKNKILLYQKIVSRNQDKIASLTNENPENKWQQFVISQNTGIEQSR